MNTATIPEAEISTAPAEAGAQLSLFRRLLRNPVAVVSMAWLALLILTSIFSPLLAPHDPNLASLQDVLANPSAAHPLGADSAGRDVLSRLLFAGRYSIAGALLTVVVSLVIGVVSGLVAGYFGGWFDTIASWTSGLLMALPGIVALLAARAVIGPSMWWAMAIFGVLISPAFFRLVYASVAAVRDELYVDAARVAGLSDTRIIARHILTVVRAPVIIQAAMVAGIAIAIQAGLEFLGLGDTTKPTWGEMLNDGFANIYSSPMLMLWPSLVIGVTSIALTLLGNAMRDVLERSGSASRSNSKTPMPTVSAEPVVTHGDADRSAEELLSVEHLTVLYDPPGGRQVIVVKDVALNVRRGEVHGLIGESGSGKTQTAWAIMRLLPEGARTTGTITFEGQDLSTVSPRQMQRVRGRKIAYVPQEPMSNLDASFTIGHQLVEPMRLCLGISRQEARRRALDLLARVGIPNPELTFRAYPHEVSGGMAQRVLIAGAISCDPDLLIADEPTTALDVTVQAEVLELLRDLQKELNMGMILVTHNFGVVADLCDTVSVMRLGRIVETGPVMDIFANPTHEYTRSLFDAILDEETSRGPLENDTTDEGVPA